MTSTQMTIARRDPNLTARLVADRRRYRRVHVDLIGRFMRADKQEFSCRMYDISVGGCALLTQTPVPVEIGEKVIAYFEHLGRLEGTVNRLLGEREPVYQTADLTILSRDVPHERIVDECIEAVHAKLTSAAPARIDATP